MALVSGAAAADEPSLDLEVSPGSARVGDQVEVVASARGGEDLLWGELTADLEPDGAWELVGGPTAVPGARPPAWTVALAPMEVGELELPEITVSVRSKDGEASRIGCDDPPKITVVSVLSADEDSSDPAPMRDPVGVHGVPWEWILPVLGTLVPLLAGALWWWRGRSGSGSESTVPALPPFAELEALVAELDALVGREPPEGVCDRLAAGLRRYLERRTGEPAEEMTSFELRILARRRGWPESAQRLVQQVMGVADGVRFGRRPSTDDELRRTVVSAMDAARTVESFLAPEPEESDAVEAGR